MCSPEIFGIAVNEEEVQGLLVPMRFILTVRETKDAREDSLRTSNAFFAWSLIRGPTMTEQGVIGLALTQQAELTESEEVSSVELVPVPIGLSA